MKNKALKACVFIALILLIPVVLIAAGLSMPSIYHESYYAELKEMYTRLSQTEGKKLVLIGGSNIAFGTDTALLEETINAAGYDYTVCPFGLYAAVGTGAMLELSIGEISEGDIVILAIEPTSESMSSYFGATAFWKCAEDAPALLSPLGSSRRSALLGNYTGYLQERYEIYRSGNLPRAEGVYAVSAFDESCNLVYAREGNTMALGFDSAMPIDLGSVVISEDFADEVNDFCRRAEKKGAAVYMSFSPINRSALSGASDDVISAFFALCNETFACPMISSPGDYILDSGWFYDSNFHLNSTGAQLRTYRLAEDLLLQLGNYSPGDYPEPEMPPPMPSAVTENTADSAYFNFTDFADGAAFLVSGLTKDGLDCLSLTIPSSYGGRPVVGFTEDALDEAASLEELYLPETIESLPDGLFAACTRLERLILAHTSRPCSITEQTFDGADRVKIFVPAEAFSLYRDGHGCEANAWSLFIGRIYTY